LIKDRLEGILAKLFSFFMKLVTQILGGLALGGFLGVIKLPEQFCDAFLIRRKSSFVPCEPPAPLRYCPALPPS